jgi:hypothetical protein
MLFYFFCLLKSEDYSSLINKTGLVIIGTLGPGGMNQEIRCALLQMYRTNIVFRNANYTAIDLAYIEPLNHS